MNREETKKAIEVMQHYADGGDVQLRSSEGERWFDLASMCTPRWQWVTFEYRIKPTPRTFYAVDYNSSGVASSQFIGPLHSTPAAAFSSSLGANGRIIELVEVIR